MKSEIRKRLEALREQAIASGIKMLSADEALAEVARRRGGEGEDLDDDFVPACSLLIAAEE
jgi:hypothetical protein